MGKILLKRAYEDPEEGDGKRILVDRLRPRGIKKEKLYLASRPKDLAPSKELRKAFHSGELDFGAFSKAYREELSKNPRGEDFLKEVESLLEEGDVSLIFSAKNIEENNAVVLKDRLEENLKS